MASNLCDSIIKPSKIDSINCVNDLQILATRLEAQFSFLTQHEVCSVCSGYYGPNFGEPVCATCHAFLFPENLGQAEAIAIWESYKKDDGDSGNDEPSDPYFGPERRHSSAVVTPSQPPNPVVPCAPKVATRELPELVDGNVSVKRIVLEMGLKSESEMDARNVPDGARNVPELNARGVQEMTPRNIPECTSRGSAELGANVDPGIMPSTSNVPECSARSDPDSDARGEIPGPSSVGVLEQIRRFIPEESPPPLNPHQLPRGIDKLAERLQLLSSPREPDLRTRFMDMLPPEVLWSVFKFLDDMSLCAVSSVCRRWRRLLEAHVTNEQWQHFTTIRWPLYRPLCQVKNWWLVYKQLVESAPCQLCLQQMAMQLQPTGEENFWRRNRLRGELKSMRADPPEGIQAIPLDRGCCHWIASIIGPEGSPYAGGIFYLYLQVPYSYPICPPMVRFVSRIFHPNVSRHGDVGIDLIHHNWSLAMTIAKVLISVQSLLTDPFCQVCMEPSIGDLYLRDKPCFDLIARTWTWKYAMHDAILPLET